MAITFQELIVERSNAAAGGGDAPGTVLLRSAARRFIVPGNTPEQALLDNDLRNNAGPGTPYPGVPALVSIGYSVGDRVGQGDDVGYYVDAEYAPVGTPTFDFPAPDRTRLGMLSAGFAPFEKEVALPLWVSTRVAAPDIPGPLNTRETWIKVENKSVRVKCMAFQIEFNTDLLTGAHIAAIRAQMNKIHVFYGGEWVFKPQRADKLFREGVWTVVYRWEADPGTSTADLAEIDAEPTFCEVAERPPHAEWYEVFDVVYPESENAPRLIARRLYEVAANGWQGLPGYAEGRWTL